MGELRYTVMMELRSIREAVVNGKRVLVRVDFNVPMKDDVIQDDSRIKAALPTIQFLTDNGATVLLATHLGRPDGKVVEELRTAPLQKKLEELGIKGVEMLENLRFDPREEQNDPSLAQELAARADIFVNDAFGTAHRAHASTVGVASLLPSYAGLLMEREVEALTEALTPPKGSIAVIGGAKFETKQPLIEKLLSLYDTILLGGALGNDVIKARGHAVGASLMSSVPVPVSIASNERLQIATDAVVSERELHAERTALINDIRAVEAIVDIGPNTARAWSKEIAEAPFVLWNGPMGIYEDGHMSGTDALAQALVSSPAKAVVGGGDTVAAIAKHSFNPSRVFLSTGGGAMLEFLAKGTLPGLEVLKK